MTATNVISEPELRTLEREVRRRMARGQWQRGLEAIREKASELGVDSDDLVKAVIRKGFELGHVRPIPQEPMEPVR